MAGVLGPKGQIVIDKPIRDRLGIGPGWQSIQRVVGDHVEVRFLPPEHNRSLRGTARPFIRRQPAGDDDWDAAVEAASADDWLTKNAPDRS